MNIPESLSIGGHRIQVVRKAQVVDGEDCFGTFDPMTLEISIAPGLPDSLALETFWHEVVEALNVFAETELEHSKIQVLGLLLSQVAASMDFGAERNPSLAHRARQPSHKKRG